MNSWSPKNLSELQNALGAMTAADKIIAGGTDLIIKLNSYAIIPYSLLYIGDLQPAKNISLTGDALTIGAGVTMSEIAGSQIIPPEFAGLKEAAADVGSLQVRNKGTIGGNIANASPAGDLLPIMFMLKAVAHIITPQEAYRVPVSQLVTGAYKVDLSYNAAIYQFTLTIPKGQTHFTKLGYRHKVTIARLGLGASLLVDASGRVEHGEVWASAIAPKPVYLKEISDYLQGKPVHDVAVQLGAGKLLADYIIENTPKEFDRDYKAQAAKGVVCDLLNKF